MWEAHEARQGRAMVRLPPITVLPVLPLPPTSIEKLRYLLAHLVHRITPAWFKANAVPLDDVNVSRLPGNLVKRPTQPTSRLVSANKLALPSIVATYIPIFPQLAMHASYR